MRAVSWARQGAARRANILKRVSMIPYTVFSRWEQGVLLFHTCVAAGIKDVYKEFLRLTDRRPAGDTVRPLHDLVMGRRPRAQNLQSEFRSDPRDFARDLKSGNNAVRFGATGHVEADSWVITVILFQH